MNMATIRPFHQALHPMAEVESDLSRSSGVHFVTPPRKRWQIKGKDLPKGFGKKLPQNSWN